MNFNHSFACVDLDNQVSKKSWEARSQVIVLWLLLILWWMTCWSWCWYTFDLMHCCLVFVVVGCVKDSEQRIGRVVSDSAESYPTRRPPVWLGGPSQSWIAESPESGPSRTRSGSTRRPVTFSLKIRSGREREIRSDLSLSRSPSPPRRPPALAVRPRRRSRRRRRRRRR